MLGFGQLIEVRSVTLRVEDLISPPHHLLVKRAFNSGKVRGLRPVLQVRRDAHDVLHVLRLFGLDLVEITMQLPSLVNNLLPLLD